MKKHINIAGFLAFGMSNPRNILVVIWLLFLVSCEPKNSHLQVLNKIRRVSDLATTEVSIKKYVLANKEKKFLFIPLKDATFAAETYAYLKFGIDLQKIGVEDVIIEEHTLTLKVPEVKLISFDYPPDEHREIAYMTTRRQFANTITFREIDKVLQDAQKQIGTSVQHMGVLNTVKTNTESALLGLLAPHGILEVILIIESDTINISKFF